MAISNETQPEVRAWAAEQIGWNCRFVAKIEFFGIFSI